jgi:vacuolar-type H+-ATPase subunit C/Vma6
MEVALRRRAGTRLQIIERWAGSRANDLAPLLDDEDRRSLRALARGATAGIEPETRLTALIPTSALPLRALEELSRLGDLTALAAALLAWNHPFAHALANAVNRPHPDLFHIDLALASAFAERAVSTARRADGAMRLFVERSIDLDNLWSVLLLSEHEMDITVDDVFLDGGTLLTREDFALAISSHDRAKVLAQLGHRVTSTPLAAAIDPLAREPEDAALHALVVEFRRMARREPLSLAPVIVFVLRQREELRALTRIIWSASLRVPPARVKRAIGSAA